MILGILHRYFITVSKRTKNRPLSVTMLITKGALASEMVRWELGFRIKYVTDKKTILKWLYVIVVIEVFNIEFYI